jgi:hypothetical protein
MPPKAKKPRKKVVKKTKQPKQRQKQRQNVNVNVKIDNSKKTNPRQPNANKTNVSRLPTGGSSTPLHTIIMPATASPSVLQREPNYAETINDLFKDAEMKQNKQLSLLGSNLEANQNRLLNQLSLTNNPYNPSEIYDALQEEHRVRNISFKPPDNFEDKNEPVKSKLNPINTQIEGEGESKEEEVLQQPVSQRTRTYKKKTVEEKQADAAQKAENAAAKSAKKEAAAKKVSEKAAAAVAKKTAAELGRITQLNEIQQIKDIKKRVEDRQKITNYLSPKKTQKDNAN